MLQSGIKNKQKKIDTGFYEEFDIKEIMEEGWT